ncbi:hypothetical protein LAZ67_X001494 [Cordylochernes scorpioides]|uniref:Uncharacterized protein n=1 Tax=Cordylochernes scorpioides TaxID=51811 RepID=A0ABY6LV57_9ARAC|nr:hypothetical protein LAZ67_X001494 [Cordylochernes scorpioides]
MMRTVKKRSVLRASITKVCIEIEAEVEKENPSKELIGIKHKIIEGYINDIRVVDGQILDFLLEDEATLEKNLEGEFETQEI